MNNDHSNQTPMPEAVAMRAGGPCISAIVPARNEAAVIVGCVVSLARQPEIGEILVINDGSTDKTMAVLQELQKDVPHLRVMDARDVPAGWVGKNHAAWLGAAQARRPWLLFTDADSEHRRDGAARALRIAAEHQAALVSFSPAQVTRKWWEKALIPFIFCRLAQRFSYAEVNDPDSPAAAANGQYLLIRREAYDAVRGHAGVASEILEDVALARRVKRAGYRLWFGSGAGVVDVRMYRSFAAMWEGWKKNLYRLMGDSGAGMRRELLHVVPWMPGALLLAGWLWPALALAGAALLALRLAAYALVLSRNGFPVSRMFYYLPAVGLYAGVLAASWRSHARGRVMWKGREYAVGKAAAEGSGH